MDDLSTGNSKNSNMLAKGVVWGNLSVLLMKLDHNLHPKTANVNAEGRNMVTRRNFKFLYAFGLSLWP